MLQPFHHFVLIPKILVTLVRSLAAAAALLLLLVALAWASLHWLIVPRIDDFRPQLAAWAGQALDAHVSAQRLSAQSQGWLPTLVVQGLEITDANGQPGLQAGRASVRLSPWNLLRGRIDALDVDAATVWLRRDAGGGIRAAGVALTPDADDSGVALHWLLAQPRISLHGGQLHWVDAWHDHEFTLDAVDVDLRGRDRRLALSVEAGSTSSSPHLSLAARLRRPLWPLRAGNWRHWGGRLQLDVQGLPVTQLADALALDTRWGVRLDAGTATLHVQGNASDGQLGEFEASVSLQQLAGRLGRYVQPLQLQTLDGTVRWQRQAEGAQVTLDDVQLAWPDGSSLTGSSATLSYALAPEADAPMRLQASHVDLDALQQLARHLPLPHALQRALHELRPAGWLDTLDARWLGPLRLTRNWQARGRIHELAVAARPVAQEADGGPADARIGRPGVQGLDVVFDASQAGGRATVTMNNGTLTFPGVFEEPTVDVGQLLAKLGWRTDEDGTRVDVDRLELANADAQGTFSGFWRTGAMPPDGDGRYPGFLDLRGRLSRGDGARVHRYLPLVLPADARHYVRDAIVQGRISNADVRVRGPLAEVPFNMPGEEGIFRISGQVDDGIMAYVPTRLQDAGESAWPALHELGGQLEFDAAAMHVRQASAQVRDHPGWAFDDISADIADFDKARVVVSASGSGKLEAALDVVRASPLAALTGHALDDAHASGEAQLQLQLDLPVSALSKSTVRGRVHLQQNRISMGPAVPPLDAAQGSVAFSESGFSIDDVQARALGGPVVISGGLANDKANTVQSARIQARGTASAAGLQQMARQLPLAAWTPLADALQGSTDYVLALDVATDGARTVALDSSLEGLAMAWPAPLDKPAAPRWPLQLRWQRQGADRPATPLRLDLQLADRLAVHWSWPQGLAAAPRGTTLLGAAAAAGHEPPAGQDLALEADLAALDVDRWASLARPLVQAADQRGAADRWFPDRWRIAVRRLRVAAHELADVSASGQRQGMRWQSSVQSPDLAGDVTYQWGAVGQPGQLEAQLSHLKAETAEPAVQQDVTPASELPSMAIVADHFVWNQLDLGRLELQASHEAGEAAPGWRIDRLVLATPQARLQAGGKSTVLPGGKDGAATNQTVLGFQLEVEDAGVLLQRLGQPGVMAGGTGSVTGELAWKGSPLALDVPALRGQLQLDLANGRFVKLEPGASKLFGVLSLQALPRRFMLDFSDIFRSGFAYDRMHAETRLDHGIISADNLQIEGVSAIIEMSGQADLQKKTQDLHVRVQPRLDAGAAALAATAISPALGAAAFVAQLALKGPLGKANAREFHVRGSWSDPQVEALAPPPQNEDSNQDEDRMPAAGENNP